MSSSIGAGVFGAWTAHHLQQRGHRVTLVERRDRRTAAPPPAANPADPRRLRRGLDLHAHGAGNSLPQWKALSAFPGCRSSLTCGSPVLSPVEEHYFREHYRGSRGARPVRSKSLCTAEHGAALSDDRLRGIQIGLLEPGFGALMARRAVQTLVDRFVRPAEPILKAGAAVRANSGDALRRGAASSGERSGPIVSCSRGPWLPSFSRTSIGRAILPPVRRSSISRLLRVTRSTPGHDAGLGGLQPRRHLLRLS